MERVAVVTGANRGIGLAIARALLDRWDGLVYLTARDPQRGQEAVLSLGHPNARFHQLDVASDDSVRQLAEHLAANHDGIDLLVNNAAIAFLTDTTPDQDLETININYRSLALMEQHLFPLLKQNARVLNISSDCGHLSNIRDQYWRERLSKSDLTVTDVDEFVEWFLSRRRDKKWRGDELADGGTCAAYRVAKVALSARTRLQAAALAARGAAVNCLHPGLVQTGMTRGVGFLTPAQAAATPLWLLLDAPQSLTGAYVWFDRRVLDWADYNADYYFKSATLTPDVNSKS